MAKEEKKSKNIFNKVAQYLSESKVELKKITWPTRKETTKLTVIVVIFSGIVAIFLGGIDYLLSKLMEFLLKK